MRYYKCGQLFSLGSTIYILAQVDENVVNFINIHSGNRYTGAIKLADGFDANRIPEAVIARAGMTLIGEDE